MTPWWLVGMAWAEPLADAWRPTADAATTLLVEDAHTVEGVRAKAELAWAHAPRAEAGLLVNDVVGLHVVAAGGLGPLRLAGWLPLYPYAGARYQAPAPVAVGDPGLGAKLRVVAREHLGLAVLARVDAPLGGDAWLLGRGAWGGLAGLAVAWEGARVAARLNGGAEGTPGQIGTWGSGAVALGLRPALHLAVEGVARVTGGDAAAEILVSGTWDTDRYPSLHAGLGAGLGVGAPQARLVVGVGHGLAWDAPP